MKNRGSGKGAGGGNSRGGFFRRNLYAIMLGFSVVTIATIVAVTLILSGRIGGNGPGETDGGHVDVPAAEFVMPVANVNLGQTAALNKLVWCRTLRQWRTHDGVDFLGSAGTEVMAVMDGTVTAVQNTIMEGTVVTINHGGGIVSEYRALGAEVAVTIGKTVKAGDKIGVMASGSLVNSAVGAHLHLRMTQGGALVDPMEFLPSGDK